MAARTAAGRAAAAPYVRTDSGGGAFAASPPPPPTLSGARVRTNSLWLTFTEQPELEADFRASLHARLRSFDHAATLGHALQQVCGLAVLALYPPPENAIVPLLGTTLTLAGHAAFLAWWRRAETVEYSRQRTHVLLGLKFWYLCVSNIMCLLSVFHDDLIRTRSRHIRFHFLLKSGAAAAAQQRHHASRSPPRCAGGPHAASAAHRLPELCCMLCVARWCGWGGGHGAAAATAARQDERASVR